MRRDVIEVTGEAGDTVFVAALEDDAIGLTAVDADNCRSVYLVLSRESVDQLAAAMIEKRDK